MFKGLEVNETHFWVPEMVGYTRHIQDYYFEHDFLQTVKKKKRVNQSDVAILLCLWMKCRGLESPYIVCVWVYIAGKHSELVIQPALLGENV